MADIEKLYKYVKKHPYHYVERWALAKKLYKTGQYEKAIRHLEILDRDWEPKVSLTRYLAATYSRLSRSEEAVQALKLGLKNFPDELPMLEQLSTMLKKTGKDEEALDILAKINEIDPNYRFPENAKRQLEEKRLQKYRNAPGVSKTVKPSTSGITCSKCGAQNKDDLLQCWQCKAGLTVVIRDGIEDLLSIKTESDDLVESRMTAISPPKKSEKSIHTFSIYMSILLAIFGGYLTYNVLSLTELRESGYTISTTYQEWLYVDLINTRLGIGVLLLIFSPFILNGAYYIAGVNRFLREEIFAQSMLLFTSAYLLAWVPSIGFWGWLLILLFGTFCMLFYLFGQQWKILLSVSTIHWALVSALLGVSLIVFQGMGSLTQWPAILAYSSENDSRSVSTVEQSLPIAKTIQWESTGSAWLDEYFEQNIVHIKAKDAEGEPSYEIQLKGDDGSTIIYENILLSDRQFALDTLKAGVAYTLEIRSDTQSTLEIKILGGKPHSISDKSL